MVEQKFNVGDLVLDKRDTFFKEERKVLGFSYSPERGYVYKTTSKEVDVKAREIVHGVSFYEEKELKKVEKEKK